MNTRDSAFVYHQSTALGASAVGQVVALYDTILRVNASNRALMVIAELQGVLDFEHGGEVARNLNNFYNVSRAMILEASMTSSREKSKEVIAMFTRLRLAWAQVDRSIALVPPNQHPRVSSASQSAVFENVPVDHNPGSELLGGDWRG